MQAIARSLDLSVHTVSKLLHDAGQTCLALHDTLVRDVKAERVQLDETWSFRLQPKRRTAFSEFDSRQGSDVWTWTAFDPSARLLISYAVGDMSLGDATDLLKDLRSRLLRPASIVTSGNRISDAAVERVFGESPMTAVGRTEHHGIWSRRRQQLRLSNARTEHHLHAFALYAFVHNFITIRPALKVSPAMAAGICDRLWSYEDLLAAVDADRVRRRADEPQE